MTSQTLDAATHTLNTSTSKNRYSFPRSDRFLPVASKPICDTYYQLPNLSCKRATTFGIGHRNPEKLDATCPSPTSYNHGSEFDKAVHRRGYSFGLGRDNVVGGFGSVQRSRQFPGPGFYETNKSFSSRSVTMKSRNKDISNKEQLLVPGPGAYDPTDNLSATGKYFSSKFVNSRMGRFNPLSSRGKLRRGENSSPGPAKYDIETSMMYSSRFNNSGTTRFPKSDRPDMSLKHMLHTPSPNAQYQIHYLSDIFSQFQPPHL